MDTGSWVKRGAAAGLLLVSLFVAAACGGDLPKGTIAQVGQSLISQDQFDQLKALYEEAGRAPDESTHKDEYRRFEQAVAEYLVIMQVLKQQASSFGISVTEQDVQDEMTIFKQMFQGDQKRFEAALKKQNLTLQQFAQQTRERLLLDRMKAAVCSGITVTDAEVRAYYDANQADYIQPEVREASHILIAVVASADAAGGGGPTEADWELARVEAEKIRAEIQNGADFASQARKYSDDEATKESGGQLGPISKGQTFPAFEEAVFSLKKRELSEPVKTPYGYHVIRVGDITAQQQLPFERVKEGIRTALLEHKIDQMWRSWLAEKQKELGVIYLAGLEPPARATQAEVLTPVTAGEAEQTPVTDPTAGED